MLEIKNLNCSVDGSDKSILDDVSLTINDGEIHVIMGPNGTGKSTLSKAIMGHYNYKVNSGDILLDGKSILNLSVDERARLGLFLCMQDPTEIDGVSNSELIRTAKMSITGKKVNLYKFVKDMESAMESVSLNTDMIHRSLNKGFSGGEKKKNEILQMKLLEPKYIILDELDSGLDVDSLRIICKNINEYLKVNPKSSLLIITHYPRILDYIKPNFVHILKDGKIQLSGDISLAKEIELNGYNNIGEDYE